MKQQYNQQFIKKPNLPTGEVTLVAISADATKAIKSLHSQNIETCLIKADKRFPEPVNSHADLQILHLGNNDFLTSPEHLCTGEIEKKFNLSETGAQPGSTYPNDVLLNCKIVGNNIFLNPKTIAKEILDFAQINSYNVITVNQGYTGCSICAINESAIITDDITIYRSAQNFLNDVLFISKNSIRLKGYDYGFIGGCCGKISANKLAVNGRIESHKDYKDIIDFTSKHNIEIVELSDEVLTDIGGILPLCEKHI
jgi:hypothetical protein